MPEAAAKRNGFPMPWAGVLLAACGFALAWLAFARLPQVFWAESFPVYRRHQLPAYALFDPSRAEQPKHVFLGSSYIVNAWVANDLDKPGLPEIEDPASSYAATAALVAAREFGASGQGFYDLGRPGPGFLDHVWYLDKALAARNLKTVIYANGPSGMFHFRPSPFADVERASLEALCVLEGWKRRYPGAAASIEAYMEIIRGSDAFARAERRFGPGWRGRVDPAALVLKDSPWLALREKLAGRSSDAANMGLRGNTALALSKPAELRDLAVWRLTWLARFDQDDAGKRTLSLLDTAARFHGDPRLDAPVRLDPPVDPFSGEEALAHRAFARMAGQVLGEAGVRLVWFFPPEVAIPPAMYEAFYRPGVVDTVRSILEPMGHVVSDHVVDHGLTQREFMLQQFTDPVFGYGYKPTSIGKLKAVRLLLEDMRRASALPGAAPRGVSCWPGEARLAPVKMCVRPYPPLDPDVCLPWRLEDK